MGLFTYTLSSGSLTISQSDYAMFVSVQCDSSTGGCNVIGNLPFKGLASTSVALGAGQGVTISAMSPTAPLDGITITWVSGTVDVIIGF